MNSKLSILIGIGLIVLALGAGIYYYTTLTNKSTPVLVILILTTLILAAYFVVLFIKQISKQDCIQPTLPVNGKAGTCTKALKDGESCRYECDTGYELDSSTTCTDGSLQQGLCQPKSCAISLDTTKLQSNTCGQSLGSGKQCVATCRKDMSGKVYNLKCDKGVLTPSLSTVTCSKPPKGKPDNKPDDSSRAQSIYQAICKAVSPDNKCGYPPWSNPWNTFQFMSAIASINDLNGVAQVASKVIKNETGLTCDPIKIVSVLNDLRALKFDKKDVLSTGPKNN